MCPDVDAQEVGIASPAVSDDPSETSNDDGVHPPILVDAEGTETKLVSVLL